MRNDWKKQCRIYKFAAPIGKKIHSINDHWVWNIYKLWTGGNHKTCHKFFCSLILQIYIIDVARNYNSHRTQELIPLVHHTNSIPTKRAFCSPWWIVSFFCLHFIGSPPYHGPNSLKFIVLLDNKICFSLTKAVWLVVNIYFINYRIYFFKFILNKLGSSKLN